MCEKTEMGPVLYGKKLCVASELQAVIEMAVYLLRRIQEMDAEIYCGPGIRTAKY